MHEFVVPKSIPKTFAILLSAPLNEHELATLIARLRYLT
jgi:hypothetical protein